MVFFLSALLLANASVTSNVISAVGDGGTTNTRIETTINGNTTTVESNQPGAIRVEKTDTSETITSDNPVTVTHNTDTGTPSGVSEKTRGATKAATVSGKNVAGNTQSSWISFLRTLWDRVKNMKIFRLLTGK